MSRFGEMVRQNRLMHHETQAEYAKRFGFDSATSVSLWEAGKRRVPEFVIEKLIYDYLPDYKVCPTCSGRGLVQTGDTDPLTHNPKDVN